jgi:predicted metal-dependent enzyme (double-stranded beta helix superfamily)
VLIFKSKLEDKSPYAIIEKRVRLMHSIRAVQAARSRLADNSQFALTALVADLGAACECSARQMGDRVVAALKSAPAIADLLSPDQREVSALGYARRLIYGDPAGRFTILALIWGTGQFSPVHAHQTWCAYAVCDHALTETEYAFEANRAVPQRTVERQPGYCCFGPGGLDQIHRLGNAGVRPATSLHVYGVDSAHIATRVNAVVDPA